MNDTSLVRERITVEQLTTFIACAEQGSFSGAARKLGRTQSVVSQAIAQLERQTGVLLFERTGRLPVLTDGGRTLLVEARTVAGGLEGFRLRARDLADGRESEVALAIDPLFPLALLAETAGEFHRRWPDTRLRLHREASAQGVLRVVQGECRVLVTGSRPELPDCLVVEPLNDVALVTVVAADHPLAGHAGPVQPDVLARHVHLVLDDLPAFPPSPVGDTAGAWRVGDPASQRAFVEAGLGWACLPEADVAEGIASGRLHPLKVAGEGPSLRVGLRVAHRRDLPPGPAGRWFIDQLRQRLST